MATATAEEDGKVAPPETAHLDDYINPRRGIFNEADLQGFLESDTYRDIVKFVDDTADAVRDVKITDTYPVSPIMTSLEEQLQSYIDLVEKIPPLKQHMRFGNTAFRTWHKQIAQTAEAKLVKLLPAGKEGAVVELLAYFLGSFGHPIRIDYGTGHETSFVFFLMALFRAGSITKADLPAAILRVFAKYLEVCRKVQTVYWLEPAGSKGVWSLDDYQMIVFLYGASQLAGHKRLKPSMIHNEEQLSYFGKDYLYLQAVQFIRSVKHGGRFCDYAPILDTISQLKTWAAVCSGMKKMYVAEVLQKFPVAQHILFGKLIPIAWTPSREPELPHVDPEEPGLHAPAIATGMAPWASKGPSAVPTGAAPWATGRSAAAAPTGVAPWANKGPAAAPTGAAPWATGAAAAPLTGVAPWAVAGAPAASAPPVAMAPATVASTGSPASAADAEPGPSS